MRIRDPKSAAQAEGENSGANSSPSPASPLMRRCISAVAICLTTAIAPAFNPAAGDFTKPDPDYIRVMSWNVHNNFIYTASKDGNYSRVIKAAAPDIIAFQEMEYSLTTSQVKARLESYFPGTTWHVYFGKSDGSTKGVSNRNAIASKYPLSMTRNDTDPTSALRGVACALVDLPNARYGSDLYVMSVHFKAGGTADDQNKRQDHADAIANWMRDARTPGGKINLPTNTPMLMVGDTNIMKKGEAAPNHPDKTLREGDIVQNGKYGADAPPDWDLSDNADASPYDHTNGDPNTHSSGTPAGRIDRFYYTDSVMRAPSKFILNTKTMSAAARSAAGGLQSTDTSGASDHLPCVVDFALGAVTPGKLLVNEYNVNDVGADDRSFIELINTSGEEINLDAPIDYFIKTSEPLPTTPPSAENEEFAYDLKGVVPANGGLFVLYDSAKESAAIKAQVEANLPKLQRQDYPGLMFRNFEYSAFSLIGRIWLNGKTVENSVEAYGYAAPNPNTTRYFKIDSDNKPTLNIGPASWTDFLAGEIGSDLSASRNVGAKNSNNYAVWTIPSTDTPGKTNRTENIVDNSDAGFSASPAWSVGTSASDKYGTDYRFHLTESVSDLATWSFSVPVTGDYEIFAWWSVGPNRSISAPYLMPDSSIVYKNQQTGGGAWQSLGTYNLTAGTHAVKLSCWTTNPTVVIADAIRILPK